MQFDLEISYLQRRLNYLNKRQRLQDQYLEYDPSNTCQERDRSFSERFELLEDFYSDCASQDRFIDRLTNLHRASKPTLSRNLDQTTRETHWNAYRSKRSTAH